VTMTLPRYLKPIASLKLTVTLFALSMFLIFAGTLAQTQAGIWQVVDEYFRSVVVRIPLHIFAPQEVVRIPGAIFFPGGLTLGVLLLVNLIAAHMVRFKLSWKRMGIILTHLGVILLLVGEFVTGALAEEGNMTIDEGASANYVEDIRTAELSIIDPSDPNMDRVVVIPQSKLRRSGATISHELLPFDVRIDRWMPNSRILGPMQASTQQLAMADRGLGRQMAAAPAPIATGVDGATVDIPSAYVTLSKDGQRIGTYLVSVFFDETQAVEHDGETRLIELRFKRTYKPYTIHLIDFNHDKFVGTERPKNFSSLVRVIDEERSVDREVLIWMNHPLRYRGETFYQSSFKPDNSGTVLQVVRNPGWLLPYISCAVVTVGMLWHFGVRLVSFSRRQAR